jgi:hypothetical protein
VPSANYVVSGTVFETANGVSRPVADQFLALFIQETEGLPVGITMRGSAQYVTTDASGHYSVQVPRSRVFVSASWGKRQPCLASSFVDKATTIDVQVFAAGSVEPSAPAGPMITGFVYETTPDGRRPLRGAAVWLDLSSDAYIANTETDEAGRFTLCRVNTTARLDVSAEGYQPYAHSEFVSGAGDRYFEFEFRR